MNNINEYYLLNADKTIDVMHLMNYISNMKDKMGGDIKIIMNQKTFDDYFPKPIETDINELSTKGMIVKARTYGGFSFLIADVPYRRLYVVPTDWGE